VSTTIVRPAIVECAREFPFAGWNEGVNTSGPLVWLVGTMHRHMPFRGKNRFDVVPVDTVARGMTLALVDARSIDGKGVRNVFHIASSFQNPLTLGRALDLTTIARRRKYAKSDDPIERFVLAHLDSLIEERAAEDDPWLPAHASSHACFGMRASRSIPRFICLREFANAWARTSQNRHKSLAKHWAISRAPSGKSSRCSGRISPSCTTTISSSAPTACASATQLLSDDEHPLFGFDVETIDWRRYWLDVADPPTRQMVDSRSCTENEHPRMPRS